MNTPLRTIFRGSCGLLAIFQKRNPIIWQQEKQEHFIWSCESNSDFTIVPAVTEKSNGLAQLAWQLKPKSSYLQLNILLIKFPRSKVLRNMIFVLILTILFRKLYDESRARIN